MARMMPQAPRTRAPAIRAPRVYSGTMASEAKNPGEDSGTADAAAPLAPSADAYPRLRHIEITNYKALDHLTLDIPAPRMPGDPDIFVVGSKNGLGKTSLLECCALAHLNHKDPANLANLLRRIREEWHREIQLVREPHASLRVTSRHSDGRTSSLEYEEGPSIPREYRRRPRRKISDDSVLIDQLFGREPDVLLRSDLLFFHGYRKVSEGPVSSQEMLTRDESEGTSAVKLKAVRLLLGSYGLVEGDSEGDAERRLTQLNSLLTTFAGGRIDKKLRPIASDQLDLRIVTPRNTTFSFDALSSGQKEIVTTLFLIWNETLAHPALVLIDEPELHLNAEWQREFLRHLLSLAPNNQYILATHSEDIFASVAEERRVLLEASHG
jgi:ABC-type molybdenum transport system ATPase subunit/photorepair protein PhrA